MIEFIEKTTGFIHPSIFFEDNALYFDIVKDGKNAGIYGLVDRGNKICESFIYIYNEYSYKLLSKELIKKMINIPKERGFNEVWTWTKLESWVKLLNRFSENGKEDKNPPWDDDISKVWFKKRY